MYEHPKFDQTVLTVIGLNCITLAMYDPTDPDCVTTRCKILTWCDIIFSSFFMLEMFIKMFAMGVFGPGAYFSTAWNKFDCFIVATSIVDFVGIQLTYLKVFRALRPLRAVNKFPSELPPHLTLTSVHDRDRPTSPSPNSRLDSSCLLLLYLCHFSLSVGSPVVCFQN